MRYVASEVREEEGVLTFDILMELCPNGTVAQRIATTRAAGGRCGARPCLGCVGWGWEVVCSCFGGSFITVAAGIRVGYAPHIREWKGILSHGRGWVCVCA